MIMNDPLEKQYNLIVAANLAFFFLVVTFAIYFNPFGFFSYTGTSSVSVEPYQLNILGLLTTGVVLSNIILIVNHIKQKIKTGNYKGPF